MSLIAKTGKKKENGNEIIADAIFKLLVKYGPKLISQGMKLLKNK